MAHTTPFAQHRCKTTSYDCILAFILGFSYTPVLGEAQNFSILKSHYHTTIAVNSQAPADSRLLQNSHQRIIGNLGVDIKLIAGDRGFDSKANQKYFKEQDIFNAVAPRNPKQLQQRLEEERFRQGQKRRSQTEGRISILGRCFCGNPMVQKGFEHREQHLGLSILSHNIWLLGRMKIAQDKQALQKVA